MDEELRELFNLIDSCTTMYKHVTLKFEKRYTNMHKFGIVDREKLLEKLEVREKSRDQQIALAAQIAELYSLITPIWGDKKWDEPDDYVLNLKGHDMLNHIKELEAKATTLKQAQEEESND